jgi:hypothetical protein
LDVFSQLKEQLNDQSEQAEEPTPAAEETPAKAAAEETPADIATTDEAAEPAAEDTAEEKE